MAEEMTRKSITYIVHPLDNLAVVVTMINAFATVSECTDRRGMTAPPSTTSNQTAPLINQRFCFCFCALDRYPYGLRLEEAQLRSNRARYMRPKSNWIGQFKVAN